MILTTIQIITLIISCISIGISIAVIIMTSDKHNSILTEDYCYMCNHKGCDNCVADSTNPFCVPSNYQEAK